MEWLKLHNDIRTDAKLRSMPMADRWIWVGLLVYANEQPTRGVIANYDPDILALEIADGDTDILCNALQRYIKLRMVNIENNTIILLNFEKRQARKPSDEREAIKERVAKHRARRKDEEDVTPVTPPVTPRNAMKRLEENREDKEEDIGSPARAKQPTQKRATSVPDSLTITQVMRDWAKENQVECNLERETEKMLDHFRGKGETRLDWVATWRTWMRRAHEFGGTSNGSHKQGPVEGARPAQAGEPNARDKQRIEGLRSLVARNTSEPGKN